MSDQQTQFQGWAAHTNEAVNGELKFQSFTPKAWDEDDVDVQVMYCGMCGTDASALAGEWGPVEQKAPLICGHEVIGKVTKVGSEVKGLKVGTVVGIGYQSDSCGACEFCDQGEENFCAKQVGSTMIASSSSQS
jgi:D-arabinose 1-dehydrogenase-like Zn-dependent alcohol dehydrogenase